ncbi:MAG: OsmC family protein [Bdellovibrionaceae bacterium]|nr:OsmC family protein [Pseudobdellovibrionaceae bacterium]
MVTGSRQGGIAALLKIRNHELIADEAVVPGGGDTGPNPHELIEAALTACTIVTLQLYANRKQWPLESADVSVRITQEDSNGTVISRQLTLKGDLSDEQRTRLLEIANKCPIHRLLTGSLQIQTELIK